MQSYYDYKKTLLKGALIFVYGGIGAIVSYLTGLPQTQTVAAAAILLTMVQNYVKHN